MVEESTPPSVQPARRSVHVLSHALASVAFIAVIALTFEATIGWIAGSIVGVALVGWVVAAAMLAATMRWLVFTCLPNALKAERDLLAADEVASPEGPA